MTNPTIKKLDPSDSRAYRAKPGKPKYAVLRWEGADYKLSWGEQYFDGPHMVVDTGDEKYGVDLRVFFLTHLPVADRRDHYVKDTIVRAKQVNRDTDIITIVNDREEMRATVKAGGWIIQNSTGELYYNSDETFRRLYEPE